MTRFKKYIILVTVLLLSYSSSWCQSDIVDVIPLTGEVEQTDSVLVPINALRVANTKMIELEYEKEINAELKEVIKTDSTMIHIICENAAANEEYYKNKIKEVKRQRNIAIAAGSGTSIVLFVLLIISL